jgi:4-amino-4-deoxy-L-arabinose transferase-like glycosyltransferase
MVAPGSEVVKKTTGGPDPESWTGVGGVYARTPYNAPMKRLFVLLAGAFLLKLVVLLQLRDHPLTQPDAGLDTTAYVELANRVLAGDLGLGPGLYYVSPLYIYFLAAALAVFDSFTAVRVLQIVLGTASIGFLYLSAREWFGERAAFLGALLATFTGLFTFYEVLILQSSIDAFLTSAALCALTRGLRGWAAREPPLQLRRGLLYLSLAGFIFGVQTMNRPNILLAAAGVAVVMFVVTRRVRPAALLLAGLLLGMAPAAIRNAVVARQWSFVSSHGGLNFYIGNSERATGFYTYVPGITPTIVGQEKDARRVAERALGRPVTDAETSSYFFGLAWTWIRTHPLEAAQLFVRKVYYVFNAVHVPLPHSYPFFARDERTVLRFLPVGPWLLIPLGLAGLAMRVRPPSPLRGFGETGQMRGRAAYLAWVSFVPLYASSVALFFVAERYRLPILVPLCMGAGAALDALGSGLRIATPRGSGLQIDHSGARSSKKSRRKPADDLTPAPDRRPDPGARAIRRPDPRWIAGVLVIGVAANWPLGLNDGRWDEGLRLAQRLVILGRYDEADRRVTALDTPKAPRPGAGHHGVGEQLLLANQVDRALVHLEAAQKADPAEPRVAYALGRALLRAGRAREAIPHLRRGFDAGIELPGGGFDLAAALHSIGDPSTAAVIERVRPAESDDVEIWLRLGRMASQVRAPQVAEPFFRRGAEMRPDLAAARQQYGLNLMVLGRFEEGARELGEAVRLDPRNPDSLSALGFCELRLGRAAEARAHAAAALAINPDDRLAGVILRGGGS